MSKGLPDLGETRFLWKCTCRWWAHMCVSNWVVADRTVVHDTKIMASNRLLYLYMGEG